MSNYAELRRGTVGTWAHHGHMRSNPNTIYGRLSNRQNYYNSCSNYTICRRHRPPPFIRDLMFEKKRLKPEEKHSVEKMEMDIEKQEEKNRLEDSKVEELKKIILLVQKTDLLASENSLTHNTDQFYCTEDFFISPQLVVRRGQEFKMTFTFQRPWAGKQDDLYLLFKLGENPSRSKKTMIKVKLDEENDISYRDGPKKGWGARIVSQEDDSLTVAVFVPPNAIIGEWEYSVITEFLQDGKKKVYMSAGVDDIIVLLNPWCKDDQVYMDDEEGIKEYVMNENGAAFVGSSLSINCRSWFYGQFQEKILDVSLHLLRKAFDYNITKHMSDPVEISRALSRILNDCDDDGVISGNWTGDYSGGVRPSTWKGSVPILQQYFEDKEPVKFGQCWVFSHVLTTVSRALGLPCRSVTNFSSAHDTDLSMTIDKYVDLNGDAIRLKNSDSVWNFHVWNEVWMHRPDLDKVLNCEGKYDGWHAIDSTPQEKSAKIYQCGPSPLSAIRNGDVHIGYDTKFIFAEVNAEVCYWRDNGYDLLLVEKKSLSIGKHISTKCPTGEPMDSSFLAKDSDNRLDITHLYKHPEGSVAERESVEKALSGGDLCDALFTNVTGVMLEVLPIVDLKIGQDITATVKVTNKANEDRSVRLNINVRPKTYWGGVIGTKKVASKTFPEEKLQPNESKTYEITIEAECYIEVCDEHLAMSILAMGVVRGFEDHENRVYTSDDVNVRIPAIEIKGPGKQVKAGEPMQVELTFTNPINKVLTECELHIEGNVTVNDSDFKKKHGISKKTITDIKPNEKRSILVSITPAVKPKKTVERELQVGLTCKQLPDYEGALNIKLLK